jgi:hypothetical protein
MGESLTEILERLSDVELAMELQTQWDILELGQQGAEIDVKNLLAFHGFILSALTRECERRGKTPRQIRDEGEDWLRRSQIAAAWLRTPGKA